MQWLDVWIEIEPNMHISDDSFLHMHNKSSLHGGILQPKDRSSDPNEAHFGKHMDHIRNSVRGIFSKNRSSHTKGIIRVGAFGDFISEKMDICQEMIEYWWWDQ